MDIGKTMRSRILSVAFALAAATGAEIAHGASRSFNLEHEHVPGQLIVGFHPGFGVVSLSEWFSTLGAKVTHRFRSHNAVVLRFSSIGPDGDEELTRRAKQLMAKPGVLYVEANTILHAYDRIPNDPKFGELYGLRNTGQGGATAGADIHATAAWEVTTGSKAVVVGIIDTGVDYTHPDIAPNYWTNPGESGTDAEGKDRRSNGIDDDRNGFVDDWRGWNFVDHNNNPMDDNEHGTHVAGTIGAKGNDGIGIVGVNWDVSIVGLKFLGSGGSGSLEDAVKAIEYATGLGVTLTSNSWGGGGFSETMKGAIEAAGAKGILFVAAAGNESANNDTDPHFPASYSLPNVISVAATDDRDQLASFSCFGATTVHLGAPGVDIMSSFPGGKYGKLSGTSMATPHVSGAAALVKAAFPNATFAEIKARLVNTADLVPALDGKTISGGRLNVANALVDDQIPPGMIKNAEIKESALTSVTIHFGAAGDDGDSGRARRYDVRYSQKPITDEASWSAASRGQVTVSAGRSDDVTATIAMLPINFEGYVAVKAIDKVGNVGPRSPSLAVATLKADKLYDNAAQSMAGLGAEDTWGLEPDDVRGKTVFSEAPGAKYKPRANASLTFPEVTVAGPEAYLSFATSYHLEPNFDFGYVEISKDNGQTWESVGKFNGKSGGWIQVRFALASHLKDTKAFRFRFRLTSDDSVETGGWKIDAVAVYAPRTNFDD